MPTESFSPWWSKKTNKPRLEELIKGILYQPLPHPFIPLTWNVCKWPVPKVLNWISICRRRKWFHRGYSRVLDLHEATWLNRVNRPACSQLGLGRRAEAVIGVLQRANGSCFFVKIYPMGHRGNLLLLMGPHGKGLGHSSFCLFQVHGAVPPYTCSGCPQAWS